MPPSSRIPPSCSGVSPSQQPPANAAVVSSPDGELVLTGGTDAARLWDAESGEEVRVLRLTTPDGKPLPRSFSVSSVAFIADGKYALGGLSDLSGDFNAAALWEVASGNVMSLIGGKQVPLDSVSLGVRTAALSPDGSSILAASEDHTVRLWDLATGHEIHSFTGHAGPVKSAAFSKTEKALIVTAGSDGTARILDAATFREILKLNASSEDLATAVFSPDGTKVATAGWDRVISLWNVADGRQIRRLEGHLGIVWSLSFSPDGRLLLSASADGTARLWNVADGRELCRLVSFPDGVWVVVDPEGRFDTNYPDQIRGLKWIPPRRSASACAGGDLHAGILRAATAGAYRGGEGVQAGAAYNVHQSLATQRQDRGHRTGDAWNCQRHGGGRGA
jgi:WD40 repeat protein